jgi:basic membrane protein A
MRRNAWRVLVVLLIFSFLMSILTGCGRKEVTAPTTGKEQEFNVGFVYIGSPGDAGWTYAHDQGRQYLEKKLPYVKTFCQESVNESDDVKRVLNELARKDCKVIFATSHMHMDSVIQVAKNYPDIVFMHCGGNKLAENVGTYLGRDYQPRYLSGLIAGKMTKNDKIGFVAAYPIPEVLRCINAFTLGVREVDPQATVEVNWTMAWNDPGKEKQAAMSLIEKGCHLICQHQDSDAVQQAAEEKGVLSIGSHNDMRRAAPNANLTSSIYNWGDYYVKIVEEVKNGTWKSEHYWGGLEDGVVALAPLADKVPAEVKALLAEKENAIRSKDFDVFEGPIKDQAGTIKVPAGESMNDDEILNFDWLVEGVLGDIPRQ